MERRNEASKNLSAKGLCTLSTSFQLLLKFASRAATYSVRGFIFPYFLSFLLRSLAEPRAPNHFCAFGLRCGQPGQQHGRRLPLRKSSQSCIRCLALVSSFFTIVTQQIHSFLVRGVSVFQSAKTSLFDFEFSSFCRSPGILCSIFVSIVFKALQPHQIIDTTKSIINSRITGRSIFNIRVVRLPKDYFHI